MLSKLPYDILAIVMDFADTNAYWKKRFTNDVLTEIDQGIAYVGLVSWNGRTKPCAICYHDHHVKHSVFGCFDRWRHREWRFVSYKDMITEVPRGLFSIRGMPFQAWKWTIVNRRATQLRKIQKAIKDGIAK